MTHLTFEQISDLAESSSASPHVDECATCRATLARVRRLLADARALPRDVAPPPEVWSAVRASVSRDSGRRATHWWHNGWLATAAAMVLVVGTATFMSFAARGKSAKAKAMVETVASPLTTPALYAVDKNYVATIRELRAALETQRSRLAPSTVQTVDRSLRVIDEAIAEARAALAADPANSVLVDILAGQYERQVDLLQRAAALSSSL
jgi:hypothetical protein